DRAVAAAGGAGLAAGADRGVAGAVPVRRRAAPVRHHLDGHLLRHGGALDAAAGAADHPGADAAADSFRRHHAARKHAGAGAVHHAGGADHPLRQPGPGDSLSRRRAGDRLAAVAGPAGDRRAVLPRRPGALSQDPGADGLKKAYGWAIRLVNSRSSTSGQPSSYSMEARTRSSAAGRSRSLSAMLSEPLAVT